MKVGSYTVEAVVLGTFRLDGGAMFGSVPKNLWSRLIPVDEENCIPLATRSLLLRGDGRVILIDCGNGEKWDEKARRIFAIHNTPKDELPFEPEEVTDLILTHLHFDHAGGVSRYAADGELVLTYPNATIHLQRNNLENAKAPSLRERASYLKDNVAILEQADVNLLDGDVEILPGINAIVVNGHTVGQQALCISDSKTKLYFLTDLVPTSRHLPVPFNMGYDICAGTVLEEKQRVLSQIEQEQSLIVFEHDPDLPAASITRNDKGHFCVKEPCAEL